MTNLHDLAVCFSFAASAFLVAWPLWAIDGTLSEILTRLERKASRRQVEEIASRFNVSEEHLSKWVGNVRHALASLQGELGTEEEAMPIVIAAMIASSHLGISLGEACNRILHCKD